MPKFYQNMECRVIAELPNDESVIELVTGMCYENNHDNYGSSYVEPIEQRIVVQNRYITDYIVTTDSAYVDAKQIIKDAEIKAQSIISNANQTVRKEYSDIQQKIKDFKKDIEELKKTSQYIETAKKFLNKEYKYVVYGINILNVDEMYDKIKNDCSYEDSVRYENLYVKINENCIAYNSYNKYNLFESLDKAKEFSSNIFKKYAEQKQYHINYYNEIVKYNIKFDGSDEYLSKCIEKHNQENLNRIDSMQKQIEECKNSIIKGAINA